MNVHRFIDHTTVVEYEVNGNHTPSTEKLLRIASGEMKTETEDGNKPASASVTVTKPARRPTSTNTVTGIIGSAHTAKNGSRTSRRLIRGY